MVNDLIAVDKIEQRLRTPRSEVIFPLASNHRKELRNLRDVNIGNIRQRLSTIRRLKREEYEKKYLNQNSKFLKSKESDTKKLNVSWAEFLIKVSKLKVDFYTFKDSIDLDCIQESNCYDDWIRKDKDMTKYYKNYSIRNNASKSILEKEFNEKYGTEFDEVSKVIDDLITKYDEAINFGDLELVRQLYYTLKDSDKMFERISKLEV